VGLTWKSLKGGLKKQTPALLMVKKRVPNRDKKEKRSDRKRQFQDEKSKTKNRKVY